MFHDIIEHINFDLVVQNAEALLKATETRDIIVAYMEMYRVDERWRGQVCRIIANTLTTPISAVGDKFILGKIKKEDRIHEVEFYYPIPLPANKDVEMPDCELKQGYIRGFVDMIFRNRNRFYIADWKSNRLEAGYGHEALETDMDNAGYHLQYKLYTIALMRWLEHTPGIRLDLEKQFGGIFYFYLRGMGTGNGNGIYYISPEKVGRLEHLEEEILDIIHDH